VKPAAAYLLGTDGVAVAVPGRTCQWLRRNTNIEAQWLAQRGLPPDIDNVLQAMAHAASRYRAEHAAVHGTPLGESTDSTTTSIVMAQLLTTEDVAHILGIKPRAVRRAIAEYRLDAVSIGRRWFITRADVDRYRKRAA
jgi:excisionase family DNA binding protein